MDWKHLLSLSPHNLDDVRKDGAALEIANLPTEQKLDSRSCKKLLRLAQVALKFRNEQVKQLQLKVSEGRDDFGSQERMKEWKRTIEKLELERHTLRTKLKETGEENAKLQSKLSEVAQFGSEGEDSPDALSEIERQQELYNNISMKNKHIKRLLRDIDDLEKRNSFQVDTINGLQLSLNDATLNLTTLTHQYEERQARSKEQEGSIVKMSEQIEQMESEIATICEEKEELQKQLAAARQEHSDQIAEWENQFDEREKEIHQLKDRYDELLSQFPGIDIEAERREFKQMTERLQAKDEIIIDLEQKILSLSKEIHRSTELMNRISEEKMRASKEQRTKENHCCLEFRAQLEKANARCHEMQEMLAAVEEDSRIKSQQAVEAIVALRRYENGEEGLASALKKNVRLQQKVNARDKQIRELIAEINLANDIALENAVLRKRLGLNDDEVVATSSILARQKKIAKVNERLALKLRASEEMRLQLKLEKNELKRKVAILSQQNRQERSNAEQSVENSEAPQYQTETTELSTSIDDPNAIKFCESCTKQYNVHDSMKHCKACIFRHSFNYCDRCVGQLKMNFDDGQPVAPTIAANADRLEELERQYQTVLEENENLRMGMHEILEKLREYDSMSDQLTIDRSMLEKLLNALNGRRSAGTGWYHGGMRPHSDMMSAREREILLKDRLAMAETTDGDGRKSKSVQSTESVNDSGNVCNEDDNSEPIEPLSTGPEPLDFSEQVLLKAVEIDRLTETLEQLRTENGRLLAVQDELQVTQKLYNELLNITRASEDEKDRLLVGAVDRLKDIESAVCTFQRKIDYLKTDNDNLHNTLRSIRSEYLNVLHDLRLQLAQKNNQLNAFEATDVSARSSLDLPEGEQIEKLESELARLKLEATNFYTVFLKNITEIDKEQLLLDVDYGKLNQFGLVDNNLTVEFIAKDEYRRLRERLEKLERELQREMKKNRHLEELLQVSNEQIRSQQSLISKYSEDEVSLRHLVVDLQSATNEKYLLVRAHKELDVVREKEENLKLENTKMKQKFLQTLEELDTLKQRLDEQKQEYEARTKDNGLKIRFLKKSLQMLTSNYSTCAPTFAIPEFIKMYTHVLEMRLSLTAERRQQSDQQRDVEYDRLVAKLKANFEGNSIQDKINVELALIKYESQSEYLTRQLILYQEQVDQLQCENKQLRLQQIENTRHWDTVELLFGDDAKRVRKDKDKFFDKEVQVSVETTSKCINTIPIIEEISGEKLGRSTSSDTIHGGDEKYDDAATSAEPNDGENASNVVQTVAQKSLESQLKQAMMLASTRSALLLEAESRLSECQGRMKLLEKSLDEKDNLLKQQTQAAGLGKQDRLEDSILSSTIGSLQNLLLEKDTTLSKYQELLKAERSEHSQVYDENMAQIRTLKKTIDELEQKLYEKQKEFDNLSTQLNDMGRLKALQESVPEKEKTVDDVAGRSSEPDAMVYTDKIIENIYEIDEKKERELQELRVQVNLLEGSLQEAENEQKRLQLQLREVTVREKKAEKMLREKESELAALNDRFSKETNDLREFTESIASAQEMEQLKEMLEEKDRHIQDLTETLSQFHEDQRNFMNDTSLHSAEQVSQLSADLNRSEASNRVLKTQIEALKRQIVSIQQREKQSRELVKTLKNQLIKRPVIAMKSDRLPTPREDQLSRRVQQLETELIDTKDELRKQTTINENRRAKTAAELDLWNKQKRWQQMAERLKIQLKEREMELEKLKVHFNTAKTTIARLERDRPRAASAGVRGAAGVATVGEAVEHHKYHQQTESPDQYCSTDSTGSEDTSIATPTTPHVHMFTQNSKDIIDALKSRIETQQRRIIAMELDRKGSNTVAHELEKMQEKLSNLEAQNVRLEAKTLQLQLDNDMLRQSDESERLKRQIKHLEEYVIVLKEELSKATVGCAESINFENLCVRCSRRNGANDLAERNASLEQTVLTLKRMIEKLRVENKHLKEHRAREQRPSGTADSASPSHAPETIAKELYDRLKKEHEKLQQNNAELLSKVSVLQVEIELLSSVSCTRCKIRCAGETTSKAASTADENTVHEELRDKLEKKSQLLEKAKILLQRAAAKERYLKEQIDLLRRKCSDLQNVPVIDEISE